MPFVFFSVPPLVCVRLIVIRLMLNVFQLSDIAEGFTATGPTDMAGSSLGNIFPLFAGVSSMNSSSLEWTA